MKIFFAILVGVIGVCAANGVQEDMLNSHNVVRRKHQVWSLSNSQDLVGRAQACARHYANMGRIDHSCPFKNGAGENLGSTSVRNHLEASRSIFRAWYSEHRHYNYNDPRFTPRTGHFTQVVWKRSRELGCATQEGSSGIYVVCLYLEHGNFLGRFRENVFPPRK